MDELDVKGRIFDIQRYSIHDGGGIRTIVFLKGCPLRCRWCCNPEGQHYNVEKMTLGGKEKIVGQDVTVGEIIDIIERDRIYYRRSGGGLTLSGGESLTQPDFAVALLKTSKERGINTAMESTGFADFSVISRYLPYLDLYLMDIKHMNSAKHKEFTSQPNELILENARKITDAGTRLIVRTPVIPTFNATKEEIGEIAKFASSLKGVTQMHILPYHRIGTDKYKGLGRDYSLTGIEPPSKELMNELLEVVNSYGLKGQIGG
ncbi:MAG: glycyl-radical enzyme activating protein [Clostridia bacterium]|nr:glycyl-radical enzyme activating protein [Clostridiales bacterium]MDD7165698.1 glycyl-radical enzyme activating protein [Clostridia bacterium]MDY2901681.1 glycyl-radical enzyme activating protein [Christensenellaceae bacterium]